ncbi:energy transducer TonB [Sinirhodobacter sp. WL0062]|uniref:Energy transducer TonB n=1 Tax=Rhodobacter flavimaris TaxID=2907145 RepID=A0ABS8YWN8_9RHOB|nr:TonB family protein [Sinirhodobacter sp. WL0062]MCE5973545.1 energy transducer TonB [Sinirhodobacter sp. WL0062]
MSLVFSPRRGPALLLGAGLSLTAHLALAGIWLAQPQPLSDPALDPGLKGREFIDLAPVEMLLAAPETDLAEGDPAQDSQAALDSPAERELAKATDDPLLAQIPIAVEDPELQFRIANPLEDDQSDTDAKETPTEVQREHVETPAAASQAAAPRPSAGQDAQSGATDTEIGLNDDEKAQIADWQKDLVLALARAKTYPSAARKARAEGKVTISFTLDRYGRVQARAVSESSGWPVLDRAALALIDEFDRLPAPPAAMGSGPFEMRFPIAYAFK